MRRRLRAADHRWAPARRWPAAFLAGTARRFAAAFLALAATLPLGGCAALFGGLDVAPNGMRRGDAEVRSMLVSDRRASAYEWALADEDRLPGDELLRHLYLGTLAHYAGRYQESAASLQRAEDIAEDRYTKSISRAGLSVVVNDRVLAYEPGETERLLIHYYGARNYLELGQLEGAAVEARRMSFLLDRYDDAGERGSDPSLRAFFRTFAGAIFEAAGEWNDANVAYRKAARITGEEPRELDGARRDGGGEVVVVIESGFVAHRVEESLNLLLGPRATTRLSEGDLGAAAEIAAHALAASSMGVRSGAYDTRGAVHPAGEARGAARGGRTRGGRASFIDLTSADPPDARPACVREESGRKPAAVSRGEERPVRGPGDRDGAEPRPTIPAARPGDGSGESAPPAAAAAAGTNGTARDCRDEDEREDPYLLRIAWPAFRQDGGAVHQRPAVLLGEHAASGAAPSGAVATGAASIGAAPSGTAMRVNLSRSVIEDFEAERAWVLARTLVRAGSKLSITRRAEEAASERNEGLGRLVGILTNAGTALLEQADTRSWLLVPAHLELVRLDAPAGPRPVGLSLAGGGAAAGRQLELGTVEVPENGTAFLAARLWR